MKKQKPLRYKGKEYTSFLELSAATGISDATLKYRINKKNMSVEEAIEKPRRKTSRKPKGYDYKNRHYDSLRELANTYGLNKRTLEDRVRKGMSIEEAIEIPIWQDVNKRIEYDYKNKHYNSLQELASAYNLNRNTLANRLNISKMTLKDALETPVRKKKATKIINLIHTDENTSSATKVNEIVEDVDNNQLEEFEMKI